MFCGGSIDLKQCHRLWLQLYLHPGPQSDDHTSLVSNSSDQNATRQAETYNDAVGSLYHVQPLPRTASVTANQYIDVNENRRIVCQYKV